MAATTRPSGNIRCDDTPVQNRGHHDVVEEGSAKMALPWNFPWRFAYSALLTSLMRGSAASFRLR
jgi:hypothetical protein